MQAEEAVLLRVAEAVADRLPVDWERAGSDHASLGSRLRWLQTIDRIAAAHGAPESETRTDTPTVAAPTPMPHLALVPPLPPEPAPAQWGPLRVLNRLGEGGFGEVYRAHDPNLGRDVALKLLKSTAAHRGVDADHFLDEARRLARVRHPNVLVVHGADRHDGRIGLWTDLLEGKTLEACLAEQGPFGADEAALVGVDLCRALAAVHAAGLLHGDVKTANVIRERGGRIVLLDFSAGRERPDRIDSSSELDVHGTPTFMAPELFQRRNPTVASDIYGLGVVLYRLATGRFPVEGSTLRELVERHGASGPVALRDVRPDLPAPFVHAVERALAPDPKARYATAGEMERALIGTLGVRPHHPPVVEPVRRPWLRPALRIAAPLAAVVVVVAAAWLLWPQPLAVEAALFRSRRGSAEQLQQGATLASDDRLFLEVEGSSPMYVYVLDEDEHGAAFVLFPLPALGIQNPLEGGMRHRLPGPEGGENATWHPTSAGGRERVLVVAAKERLVDFEQAISRLPRAGESNSSPKRGIGGIGPDPNAAATPLVSGLLADLSNERGVETWTIELQASTP
jgi:hypothetical protein